MPASRRTAAPRFEVRPIPRAPRDSPLAPAVGAETRKALQAFVDNYEAKLDAWETVVQAVSQRDPDSERQALEKMSAAAAESRQLVASLVARLSPAERLEFSQAQTAFSQTRAWSSLRRSFRASVSISVLLWADRHGQDTAVEAVVEEECLHGVEGSSVGSIALRESSAAQAGQDDGGASDAVTPGSAGARLSRSWSRVDALPVSLASSCQAASHRHVRQEPARWWPLSELQLKFRVLLSPARRSIVRRADPRLPLHTPSPWPAHDNGRSQATHG